MVPDDEDAPTPAEQAELDAFEDVEDAVTSGHMRSLAPRAPGGKSTACDHTWSGGSRSDGRQIRRR
jgi:hypothetical protein